MPPDLRPPLLLLLHDGGWDEVLMVAAALGIAYLVIVWTGRRSRAEEDEELEQFEEAASDTDPPKAMPDQTPTQRS